MNHTKYKILLRVHAATSVNPARRRDFLKGKRNVITNNRNIDELIERKYLSEAVGSDHLTITSAGVDAMEAEQERLRLFWWDFCRYAVTTAIALIALAVSIISFVTR